VDPKQVWREAEGQSKQRTVRAIWPALADALDGKAADEPEEVKQPLCEGCGSSTGKYAIGRAGEHPVCGACCARRPYAGLRLTRVTDWLPGRAGYPRHKPGQDRKY